MSDGKIKGFIPVYVVTEVLESLQFSATPVHGQILAHVCCYPFSEVFFQITVTLRGFESAAALIDELCFVMAILNLQLKGESNLS